MALWTPRVRLERPSYFRLGGYGVQWAVSETDVMATWRGGVLHGTDAGLVPADRLYDTSCDVFAMSVELSQPSARWALNRLKRLREGGSHAAEFLRRRRRNEERERPRRRKG